MAHIAYQLDGRTVALEISNAEELTPERTQVGDDAVAVDGTRERLHYRVEKRLTLRIRRIPDCMVCRWEEFLDATLCQTCTLHLDGRLACFGWDMAEAFRSLETQWDRDGAEHWALTLKFERHGAAAQ